MKTNNYLNWIELSKSALNKNINSLKNLAGNRMLAVSVKANAYGHGLPEIVSMLKDNDKVNYLTVHSLDEAVACRNFGWERNILVMGPIAYNELESVVEYNLEPVVFEKSYLNKLGKLGDKHNKKIKTHLKLETGTNRLGINETALPRFVDIYNKYKSLGKPYGAYTHFANIEDTTDHSYAKEQLALYNKMLQLLKSHNVAAKVRHTASSAATILFSKTHFDMVRPGISAYGHWPSKETYLSYQHEGGSNNLFKPVLSWRTRVAQIKRLEADQFIGYGCTYRTTSKSKIAVLPIGYYDGYNRNISNQGHMLINGHRSPIRGRICMNICMTDVSDISQVKVNQEVTIIGRDGREAVSAENLADWGKSINYEILAGISSKIQRLITK